MNSEIIKKLSKIILLILLISYGIDKLVFFGLNKISDKVMTGQAIGKLNHFLSIKDSLDLIIFGNSRANHHVDVDLFSTNSYNMGVDGSGIAYSSTLLSTLQKDKKQFVIVHIDTKNFFNANYDARDLLGLKAKYRRNNSITEALINSKKISKLQQFYYSINYNQSAIGIIKNYFKPSYDYKTYNGYDPLTVSKSQKTKRDIILSKLVSVGCLDNYNINQLALQYLKSIKSYTAESPNKTFLFITTPRYNDFCNKDNAKLAAKMQQLDLTYWDFTNLYKELNDNSYWKDPTHMSKKGAKAFSKHLLKKFKTLQN